MHVVLVHGLGRTARSMRIMARALRSAGHTAEAFGYIAALMPFAKICDKLHRRLADLAATGAPYAVVGHSLGGLLLRCALAGVEPAPAHFIMLGTPNQPPRLARKFRRAWPFRLVAGDPGQRLSDLEFYRAMPLPRRPYTLIAGTAGPRGRLSPFGDEPNDWLVAVSETRVTEADVPLLLPVEHTFMPRNPVVCAAVCRILAPAPAPAAEAMEQ